MARVYRAEHAGLKRQVALKVMTQGFARDSEGRERFLREARIAAAIKHPNVVNIFDVGVCQGIPYLVMELLEGEDLEKVLLSRGTLDESTIIDLVVPVVAGLVAVHDAGIVHRDLKPGNIFLARGRNDEFEPKLLDFGISKASGNDHMRLTAANGSLMGTPFYMAPEAVQGADMTPLSDQYALGVVLRECATGKNPFESNNFAEVVGLITSAKYPPLAETNPRLSKRFVAIIERAMNVDPQNRFDDMRAMGRQLLLLAGQRTRITWGLTFGQEARGQLALAVPERQEPDAPSADAPARKRRTTALLLGAVAVLSASLTSLLLTTDREGSRKDLQARAGESRASDEVTAIMPNEPKDGFGNQRAEPIGSVGTPTPPIEPPVGSSSILQEQTNGEEPEAQKSQPKQDPVNAEEQQRKTARAPSRANERSAERRPRAAASRAAVSRRARPTPAPAPVAPEPEADWEIEVSSKLPNAARSDVEVGSNNAPILD
jgi:serine/threonine-protein kinase